MKTAVIFVALIATCAASDVADLTEVASQLHEVYDKCLKDLSTGAIYNLMLWGGLEDTETNCARACMMTMHGTMADNKINFGIFKEGINALPWMETQPEVKDFTLKVIEGCRRMADTGADECEVAGKWNMCYRNMLEQLFVAVYTAVKAVLEEAAKADE